MANPTTNFGWVMPTSASLVTNLPADFNVFGQAVDTSMQYLLGGTTGQILSKTSGTNMAFTWIANDQGDITGVTAGTGISVTSPTGPVPTVAIDTAVTVDKTTAQTLTNKTLTSPALTTPTISTATTNGDILYGTGSGALARLGIGSSSQVLTVASGIPSWATPSSTPSFAGCGLTKLTGAQSIPNATYTAVTFVESFDVGGYHDDATNPSRITIPTGKGGKYRFSWREGITIGVATVRLYINGTGGTSAAVLTTASGEANGSTKILNLAAADYVEVYLYQASGSAKTAYDENNGAVGQIWFDCEYLGA